MELLSKKRIVPFILFVSAAIVLTYISLKNSDSQPTSSSETVKNSKKNENVSIIKPSRIALNNTTPTEPSHQQNPDNSYPQPTAKKSTPVAANEPVDKTVVTETITECVSARTEQKEQCEVAYQQLKERIKRLDSKQLTIILNQLGQQRSEAAREYLWTLITDFEGEAGATALREFYLDRYSSAPANFHQQVRFRFQEIATPNDVEAILELYLKNDPVTSRRIYSLVNLLSDDNYIPVLEESFQQAQTPQKKELFLVIANTNSPTAFAVIQNILADDNNWSDETELNFYLRGVNFIKTTDVQESMLTGINSANRGERLASYVVLQNFNDDETIQLTESLLQQKDVINDPLAKKILDKVLSTQLRKADRLR